MSEVIQVPGHVDLAATERDALQSLFNSEYLNELGPWNPDAPYGWPSDVFEPGADGALTVAAEAKSKNDEYPKSF